MPENLTLDQLREMAADYQRSAERWRAQVVREEQLGGRGNSWHWPETKAILVEMAEGYERDAKMVLARAAELESKAAE